LFLFQAPGLRFIVSFKLVGFNANKHSMINKLKQIFILFQKELLGKHIYITHLVAMQIKKINNNFLNKKTYLITIKKLISHSTCMCYASD